MKINEQLKRRPSLKIGDIYKINIDEKKHSYGQYIYTDWRGPVVRVFNIITDEEFDLKKIINTELMFLPVRFGIGYALKKGLWEKIGNSDVSKVEIPKFRSGNMGIISKKVSEWFLIDAGNSISLGPVLPEKYKNLELDAVWSAEDLAKRIKLGGKIPYPAWEY